jgi:AraC family transcriptional regulator, melibiose operon regulatory protein
MKSFDATRADFVPYGLTCEHWLSVPMPRPDRHNEVELNFLLDGSLSYFFGGAQVTIPPRYLAAFWAAIPHQVLGSPSSEKGADYYVVTIPLLTFLQLNLPDRLVQPILHGQMILEPQEGWCASAPERFEQWADDLEGDQPDQHRAVLLEIEALLLRLALRLPEQLPIPYPGSAARGCLHEGRLSKVEQMAAYIAQHYTEPLQIDEISHAVGLHPGYAMTLFKKSFGMTLIEYVNQHRITHAQRLLATTDKTILSIALESGFGSLSRFNDAFKRACGYTPRQHRKKYQPA